MLYVALILVLMESTQTLADVPVTCMSKNSTRLSLTDTSLEHLKRIFGKQKTIANQMACGINLKLDSLSNEVVISWGPLSSVPSRLFENLWVTTTLSYRFDSETEDPTNSPYIVEVDVVCMSRTRCEAKNIIDRFHQMNAIDYAEVIEGVYPIMRLEDSDAIGEQYFSDEVNHMTFLHDSR